MVEFILGVLFSWWFLGGLSVSILLFEYNDAYLWSALSTILLGILVVFALAVPASTIGLVLIAWIPVGFIWSFWRWRKHCIAVVSDTKRINGNYSVWGSNAKSRVQKATNIKENADLVVYWIIAWPFSMVVNVLDDIITTVKELVLRMFKKVYDRITASALKGLNIDV